MPEPEKRFSVRGRLRHYDVIPKKNVQREQQQQKSENKQAITLTFFYHTSTQHGGPITKTFAKLIPKKQEQRIPILGLDAAVKTTVLYSLELGEVHNITSTIGFNVENLFCENIEFRVWDIDR